MKQNYFTIAIACSGICMGIFGLTRKWWNAPAEITTTAATKMTPEEHGRYLIRTGGCNDCHTPRFMELGEKVPETEWLTGVPVGWRGPWGTSYASNLRQHIAAFKDAGVWIGMVRNRGGLPPMPWASLHAMTDGDLRDVYAYISSLEVKGGATPHPVPPDQEPATPYLDLKPVMPRIAGTGTSLPRPPATLQVVNSSGE